MNSPIGKYVELRGEPLEIIGIAGDALYYGLRGAVPPTIYTPWIQQQDELLTSNVPRAQFAIRTDHAATLSCCRRARGRARSVPLDGHHACAHLRSTTQ